MASVLGDGAAAFQMGVVHVSRPLRAPVNQIVIATVTSFLC
jgi:hypothetical protein